MFLLENKRWKLLEWKFSYLLFNFRLIRSLGVGASSETISFCLLFITRDVVNALALLDTPSSSSKNPLSRILTVLLTSTVMGIIGPIWVFDVSRSMGDGAICFNWLRRDDVCWESLSISRLISCKSVDGISLAFIEATNISSI
jgi:hypothetical protein